MKFLDGIKHLFRTPKSPQIEAVKNELEFRANYDFVDIGCGETALRVEDLAKEHPDWYLMAVDPGLSKTETNGNVCLVKGLAEVVLTSLPERSIQQANSDYFLLTQDAEPVYHLVLNLLSTRLTENGVLYIRHRKDKEDFLRKTLAENGLEIVEMKRLRGSDSKYLPGVPVDLRLMKALRKYVTTRRISREFVQWPEIFKQYKGNEEVWQPMEYVIKHKK